MNVNLRIERLVLQEVAISRPALLEAAFTAEITRLLAGGNVPSLLRHGGSIPDLRTAEITLAPDSAAVGAEIGRAVHAGLSRGFVGTTST